MSTETPPCDRTEFDAIEKARSIPVTGYAMAATSCSTLATLAELASRQVELPVLDRTGLPGRWSATVYFAPDPSRLTVAPDPNLASFPAALQEQLGLKLEPTSMTTLAAALGMYLDAEEKAKK